MRFGNWRGVTLAAGLVPALLLAIGLSSTPARAQDCHAIPRLVPAIDLNTGGPYYAPPIPYGHYAKNLDDYTGKITGPIHGLLGKFHGAGDGLCNLCGGKGCSACGGTGHHGIGTGCSLCGGKGCSACMGQGGGLFHHGGGTGNGGCDSCGTALLQGHDGGLGLHKGLGACGLCGGKGCGACLGYASNVVAATAQGAPTPQAAPVVASAQCGDPACGLLGKHHHKGCGLCGGTGLCGGKGCRNCAVADPCGACGGRGCGLCGGNGFGHGHGLCSACGGHGCNACGGKGLCPGCGGAGCGLCGAAAGAAHGLIGHLLGRDKIKWFVGPGGPIPLTPGYTPYVNVTRSPRDFFAFPPMTP